MKSFCLLALLFSLLGCKKETSVITETIYTDLSNKEVKYNQIQSVDINNDKIDDFYFVTSLIGGSDFGSTLSKIRPLLKNRLYIKYDEVKDYHVTPAFNKDDMINAKSENDFQWGTYSAVTVESLYTTSNDQTTWMGPWKQAQHKYLPVCVFKDNSYYYGWIELSVNEADEKIILHKAALRKIASKEIGAGQ